MNTPWLPNGIPHPADQLLTQRIRVVDRQTGRVYPCLRDLTRAEERRRTVRFFVVAGVVVAVLAALKLFG